MPREASLVFLRNLNRVLVQTSQVLSLSLLDGPFTTVFTIKPPETGCFECFEQRLLARMEESPHIINSSPKPATVPDWRPSFTPAH